MAFERLPPSVHGLYAELLELEQLAVASGVVGVMAGGSFVSKRIGGRVYWYLQRGEGSSSRQLYLGPDSPALRRWMEDAQSKRREERPNTEVRRRLCSMLVAGGAAAESAAVIKVLSTLADAGVFRLGGVLVGTLAFRIMANVLGVKLAGASVRTQDVDIAHDPAIGVALAVDRVGGDVPRRLGELEPPFLPVPGLDPRSPSTTFKVRGQELRVDFLTPLRGKISEAPVKLDQLGCSAQPLRFLGYLMGDAQEAVAVGGSGVLVNLPQPARLALHKLFTAESRSSSEQAKAGKDRAQAAALLNVLAADRPGDIDLAWRATASSLRARKAIANAARGLVQPLKEALRPIVPELVS